MKTFLRMMVVCVVSMAAAIAFAQHDAGTGHAGAPPGAPGGTPGHLPQDGGTGHSSSSPGHGTVHRAADAGAAHTTSHTRDAGH
jgi:hypothetical protein